MKQNESIEVAEPDIEIVVRNGNGEVAVFGLFRAGEFEWDVIVGITEADERFGVQSALQLAIDAVSRAHFIETGDLSHSSPASPPPF